MPWRPQPHGRPAPRSPSVGWQAGDLGSQMEESDSHPPPGRPSGTGRLKASVQGQSINGGTGSPSLRPTCAVGCPQSCVGAGGTSDGQPDVSERRSPEWGCSFSWALNERAADSLRHAHTRPHTPTSPDMCTPEITHTDSSKGSRFGPFLLRTSLTT